MTAVVQDETSGVFPKRPRPQLRSRLSRRWRSFFAIAPSKASFAERGFPSSNFLVRNRLERIGTTFLVAFNHAVISDDCDSLWRFVETIEPDRRGFAVEGAAMGVAIADATTFGGTRLKNWMRRADGDYTYLAHVGVGWALARAPWRRKIIGPLLDPVHHWLTQDGLGFHDAYFSSRRIAGGWRRVNHGYGARAYDQGVGRALWFIAGGDPARAVATLTRLAAERRADLWSGLGLAATYAGGASPSALEELIVASGRHRPNLAQGAAFAAEAHLRANHIPTHTQEATLALAGIPVGDAAALVRQVRDKLSGTGSEDTPPYEIWRREVQRALKPL